MNKSNYRQSKEDTMMNATLTSNCDGTCHEQRPDRGTCALCGSLDLALMCDACAYYATHE